MATTAEIVRKILRSWLALEVLTPQVIRNGWGALAADRGGQQQNKETATPDDPRQWEAPGDDELPPWPLDVRRSQTRGGDSETLPSQPVPDRDQTRPWYLVVLGALPARQAFECLDTAFSDEADEDETNRQTEGYVIGATMILDEQGVLVPDTLAIASFAWGLGHVVGGGSAAELAEWEYREQDLKLRFRSILAPTGTDGCPRSLTWRDVRAASHALAEEFGLPPALWLVAPCAIRMMRTAPPKPDILSSFLLPDLGRVLREADHLPKALASYIGLHPPSKPWDALTDREQLSLLLQPDLFPLGRWPGPGLHPLTLLQQAAVNAIVRDLERNGITAVNGPPGTGKTTLLRDLVAHVLVSRAELLAKIEDPRRDLPAMDLMDFAVVVASSNNTAVENVSLELPIRGKALDPSIWRDSRLEYFHQTADAVLDVPPSASDEEHAWGLLAARLGKTENRREFFERFWWDPEWGLNDWLNLVAWPDTPRNRNKRGKLAEVDRPPRFPEAMASWRKARDAFRQAFERCRRLRTELEDLSAAGSALRQVEARLPEAENWKDVAERDLASAGRAAILAQSAYESCAKQQTSEESKLAALSSTAPSWFSKLFRTSAWHSYEAEIRDQVGELNAAQAATQAAKRRLTAAAEEQKRCEQEHESAREARASLRNQAEHLARSLKDGQARTGGSLPGPGFWCQSDEDLQRSAPWNGGPFRAARDDLFVAAIRLHRAFIVAAARAIKPSLNTIAKAVQGGADAPSPTAADWGVFFLVVPVVSTTFASVGRMFHGFGENEIGWLLIDEAGQATPQAAVGSIWRARRAVVIGDPLQIEPIVTTPMQTTQRIFRSNGVDPMLWAAPRQSAQTLADRTSEIQGRFWVGDGEAGREQRITGIPLLVHRRCERPMFTIANRIAYDERMVFATAQGASRIRDTLGCSAWIDVDAPSADKWVEAEGHLIVAAMTKLCAALPEPPNLYVICPFRVPSVRLRALLRKSSGVLPRLKESSREKWLDDRVGTVHTFQGKEAEAVILMLGAGRGARVGSRSWAGGRPNLLNVASTRAKRALYVVGNRAEWGRVGVFVEAAIELKPISGQEWLSAGHSDLSPQGNLQSDMASN